MTFKMQNQVELFIGYNGDGNDGNLFRICL